MPPKVINAISLFSGTAQLDKGVSLALEQIGYKLRTVLYCEKDMYCQEILRARIADGLLDDAPIWPDVSTLPASGFRGHVGALVFGFPCQPFSHAGKRAGTKDERYLFGDAVRIALDVGTSVIFCENVPGLLAPTTESGDIVGEDVGVAPDKFVCPAPIADVHRILAEGGYHARWTDLGAEDIGAPHGRHRWWCIAWRITDTTL